jgi:hypothetical protein
MTQPHKRRPPLLAIVLGLCLALIAFGKIRRATAPAPATPVVSPEPAADLTPWLWAALIFALAAILLAAIRAHRK